MLGARSEPARADSDCAKIPKGGRFAAAAAAIVVSLLAVSGAGGAGAQTPKRGGTVVYGTPNEPPCLNILIPVCSSVPADGFVPGLVLKGAFKIDPGNTFRPDLATVEFTRKPPFTLTYHIRPEAHWSDGVPISAQDFVFTHRAIVKYVAPDANTNVTLDRTMVRSVRALGPKTVRVVLRTRFAGWRGLFSSVLPRHALAGEDLATVWTDRIDNPKTGQPIGSGPFLVGLWERGKQLTLVRNARYWGPHAAYLDRLVLRSFRQNPEALQRGEGDIHWAIVGRQEDFPRFPGYTRRFRTGMTYQHFEIRLGPGGHPALESKLVRRALAYGIDRVGVIRSLFGEIDPKLQPLDSSVFVSQSPFYRPNWNIYRHRPPEARRLLEQAGCRLGPDGIYVCAGEKLSLRVFTTAGVVWRELAIQLVQKQLRRAGIEVKPIYAPSAALFGPSGILASGDFDLALFGSFSGPDPTGLDDIFGCGGSANLTGYCQRLVTRDLDQADRILDQDERARVLNRADAQMARDVPVIPLLQALVVAYVRSNIRNFVMTALGDYWNAENWWLER